MRFFVPSANDLHHSEEIYRAIHDRVGGENQALSDRRIYQLKFRHKGRPRTAVVGSDSHGLGKGPVVAIFEGLDGRFYVCTQEGDSLNPQAHAVDPSEIIEVQEFSALA